MLALDTFVSVHGCLNKLSLYAEKPSNFKRKDFQIYLEKRDVQTRVVFTGNILRQPMMKSVNYQVNKGGYPNADAVMERGVLLPLHHGMTDEMFERLHNEIDNFLDQL